MNKLEQARRTLDGQDTGMSQSEAINVLFRSTEATDQRRAWNALDHREAHHGSRPSLA